MKKISKAFLHLSLADQALGHGLEICPLDVRKLHRPCLDGYFVHDSISARNPFTVGGLSGCNGASPVRRTLLAFNLSPDFNVVDKSDPHIHVLRQSS